LNKLSRKLKLSPPYLKELVFLKIALAIAKVVIQSDSTASMDTISI